MGLRKEQKATRIRRLHFLEQFTCGRPNVFGRSCQHMHPDRGYIEAKKCLSKHFGNEYTIASAYIERALKWPLIRSEDGEALTEFAVFLTGCCNTVDSMEYIEEMGSPTSMRAVISKLPFKLGRSGGELLATSRKGKK